MTDLQVTLIIGVPTLLILVSCVVNWVWTKRVTTQLDAMHVDAQAFLARHGTNRAR